MVKFLQNTKYLILYTLLFLFPLFFLPFTQEFFVTNKLYLLAFGSLLLLLTSSFQLLVSKKLVWEKRALDVPLVIFTLAVGLSIVLSSPNKVQAVLSPNYGLVGVVSLTILYFYLSRSKAIQQFNNIAMVSVTLLSLITIVFFFQPLKNANLPQSLVFLKNVSFTPLGSQIDLAIFLGFFVLLGLVQIIKDKKTSILNTVCLTLISLAFLLTLYSLFQPTNLPTLPPFNLSWYAAVETLKNPLTALFGVGIDNFSSMFTRVKDMSYNQSTLWQVSSFSISRSAILHIFTESGLFGLLSLGLVLFFIAKQQFNNLTIKQFNNPLLLAALCLLLILLFFPPSLPVFFLFFMALASLQQSNNRTMEQSVDLRELLPIYLGTVVVSLLIIAVPVYFLGRSYAAEYYFKISLNSLVNNDAKELYDNQRQAIILNPYIERYRINFSQTNLLLANNVANNAKENKLSETDKQLVSQAIQAAIAEAKAAVALNPQKAGNWENLALIYRNILAVAQGADAWTISAYQRAIILDPQNPIYRLNLGGVYYSMGNYDQALLLFQQAISLKPDWANSHYNLAWASYQKKDYQLAAAEMQNALSLVDPKTDKADFDKAQKELVEFKKLLPKESETSTGSGTPNQLTLPTPAPTISPRISLPKEASPEAK